jgi:hypothetical protein
MITFDYDAEAELFPSKSRTLQRKPVGYKRFARAADAIRFAIEDLPAESLTGAWLEVAEDRFNALDIRRLYDHEAYPLDRTEPAAPGSPTPGAIPRTARSPTKRPLWWSRS